MSETKLLKYKEETIVDKILVNAAIAALLDQNNPEFEKHALILTGIISEIKSNSNSLTFSGRINTNKKDKKSQGYAPGVGNVNLGGDKKKVIREFSNETFSRIGKYKLSWDPKAFTITIQHFWQADSSTNIDEDTIQTYFLNFTPKLKPINLTLRVITTLFPIKFWKFEFSLKSSNNVQIKPILPE